MPGSIPDIPALNPDGVTAPVPDQVPVRRSKSHVAAQVGCGGLATFSQAGQALA
jgi:hypothetical protein